MARRASPCIFGVVVSPTPPINRRHAFTLVELLVVVGIIAILTGILMPALRAVRASARTAQCASTLRSFAQANQTYSSQYNGWFVPFKIGPKPPPTGQPPQFQKKAPFDWQPWYQYAGYKRLLVAITMSNGYLADDKAYYPPSFICPDASLTWASNPTKGRYDLQRSYGYNGQGKNGADKQAEDPVFYRGWRQGQIKRSADKIMFADSTHWGWEMTASSSGKYNTYGENTTSGHVGIAYRHKGGVNVAFWDGHVEWLPKEEVISVSPSNSKDPIRVKRWDLKAD